MFALEAALSEALVASVNPMNGMMRDYVKSTIATQQIQLDEQKLEFIEKVQTKLAKAQSDGSDQTVITALQKMLAKATA